MHNDPEEVNALAQKVVTSTKLVKSGGPPPYGSRQGWIPRCEADFGDGGAFPEIAVAQFPLDMGRRNKTGTAKTVALTTNADGEVKYDAILQHGRSHETIVQSTYKDLATKVFFFCANLFLHV